MQCGRRGRRDRAALDDAEPATIRRERGETRVEPDRVEPHGVLAQPILYT